MTPSGSFIDHRTLEKAVDKSENCQMVLDVVAKYTASGYIARQFKQRRTSSVTESGGGEADDFSSGKERVTRAFAYERASFRCRRT